MCLNLSKYRLKLRKFIENQAKRTIYVNSVKIERINNKALSKLKGNVSSTKTILNLPNIMQRLES